MILLIIRVYLYAFANTGNRKYSASAALKSVLLYSFLVVCDSFSAWYRNLFQLIPYSKRIRTSNFFTTNLQRKLFSRGWPKLFFLCFVYLLFLYAIVSLHGIVTFQLIPCSKLRNGFLTLVLSYLTSLPTLS